MNYFLDQEFSERHGVRPTIELISIGIVCEDSRTFYAESADFNEDLCNPWVKENVLPHLGPWNTRRANESIAKEVLEFIDAPQDMVRGVARPQFWTYYGAYDWVVFAWLFGIMADLPEGFPMHPMDLQQWWVQMGEPDIKPPHSQNEHHALSDALWNQQFHHALLEEHRERWGE